MTNEAINTLIKQAIIDLNSGLTEAVNNQMTIKLDVKNGSTVLTRMVEGYSIEKIEISAKTNYE